MRGLPAIWFGLLLLALLTALTFWIDRTVQPPAPKRDGSTRHAPDYIVNNFLSTRTDGFGNPRYDLAGVEMRHYPDDDSTELVRPHYTIYSQQTQTTQIFSDKGKVSANGENVYFMDNVRVVRAETVQKPEMTVLTSYLHVIPDQSQAQTDRPVTILQAPRTVIRAGGMQYYKKEGVLNLFKRVKVHYERPGARALKPMTAAELAAKIQFLDQVPSVVKPTSSVAPVVPAEKPAENSNKPVKKVAPKTQATVSAKPGKKTGQVAKKQKEHKSDKKPATHHVDKTPANKTKTGATQSRIRRHYENP
jgi:lipopolysaccharide export system protein LptC